MAYYFKRNYSHSAVKFSKKNSTKPLWSFALTQWFPTRVPWDGAKGAVRWCQGCRQLLDLLEFLVKLEVILELGYLKSQF